MCEVKPLPRCAGHAGPALERALAAYRAACPGGGDPCVLLAAETQIGRLHAAVKAGEHWLRDAETDAARAEAERFVQAARERLRARWAERDAASKAAELTGDEQERWDVAEHDRRHAEERQAAYEQMADARVGIDDDAAARYDRLAAHHREAAADAKSAQERILAGARARRSAPAPAVAPMKLNPQRERLAFYAQFHGDDELITSGQAQELLGVDAAGLAALEREGQLAVALEADATRRRPATYRFGAVRDLAGPMPEPGRSTKARRQEHTAFFYRRDEAERMAAFRELEARRNRAESLAA